MAQKKSSLTILAAKKQAALRQPVMQFVAKHHEEQDDNSGERHRKIAGRAYCIAEQRGFHGDHAIDDWLQAEAQIDAMFAEQH